MAPTFNKVYEEVGLPYMNGDIKTPEALEQASGEFKNFMILNTRESDISMFSEIAGKEEFYTKEDIPFSIALPAFITSELKTAFQIGFLLFLPFLVIDMVVASVLNVIRHDDAFTYVSSIAFQNFIICFSRWMEYDCWFFSKHICFTIKEINYGI